MHFFKQRNGGFPRRNSSVHPSFEEINTIRTLPLDIQLKNYIHSLSRLLASTNKFVFLLRFCRGSAIQTTNFQSIFELLFELPLQFKISEVYSTSYLLKILNIQNPFGHKRDMRIIEFLGLMTKGHNLIIFSSGYHNDHEFPQFYTNNQRNQTT